MGTPRIYDTFIMCDELDLLECRLRELENSKVYKHIIVEADETFQGKKKPLHFRENEARFAQWSDRIIYVPVGFRDQQGPWERQSSQRQAIGKGLVADDADPDDLILYSDLDEIPAAEIVDDIRPQTVLLMNQHCFAVNWLHPRLWLGTTAERMGNIKYFDELRDKKLKWGTDGEGGGRMIGGWHLSWLGGPEAIKAKARSYAHTELTDAICEWSDQGYLYELGYCWDEEDVTQLSIQQIDLVLDPQWPQWIIDKKCPEVWFHPQSEDEAVRGTIDVNDSGKFIFFPEAKA
jgi:hypothetical protein